MAWRERPRERLRPTAPARSSILRCVGRVLRGGAVRDALTWLSLAGAVTLGETLAHLVAGWACWSR